MDVPNMSAVSINLDDVAADFVEQEVGQHDWVRNWQQMRAAQDPVERVSSWMQGYQLRLDPAELVQRLDDMAALGGAWR